MQSENFKFDPEINILLKTHEGFKNVFCFNDITHEVIIDYSWIEKITITNTSGKFLDKIKLG